MMPDHNIQSYRKQIEAALGHAGDDSWTFEDVVAGVNDGRLQFWPAPNSVIVTQIITDPSEKTLHFFLAGGNLTELEAMTPLILDWGRERGCGMASLIGRRGWERTFLARTGWYKADLVIMGRKL